MANAMVNAMSGNAVPCMRLSAKPCWTQRSSPNCGSCATTITALGSPEPLAMAMAISICSCLRSPAITGANLAKHVGAERRLVARKASLKENVGHQRSNSQSFENDLNYSSILSENSITDGVDKGHPSSHAQVMPIMTLADASVQSEGQQSSQELGEAGGKTLPRFSKANLEATWENLVETTEVAIDKVPGPRVGPTRMPWLVAVPVTYAAVSFVIAIVKFYQKANSPRAKRKKQLSKNQTINDALNEFFPNNRTEFDVAQFRKIQRKTGFSAEEVLRKHIRYTLNERPFNPDLVADLLHLRKVSSLPDETVVEVLNDVARRVVKAKGAVMMNTQGMTEKGIKRKAAVQALFSKLLYLSELEEFCSSSARDRVQIKSIFGVTDEDTDLIRIDTLSEPSDMDALEMMVNPPSTSDADSATKEDDDVNAKQ